MTNLLDRVWEWYTCTHYYFINYLGSRRVGEPGTIAIRSIRRTKETWSDPSDQVTIVMMYLLYTFNFNLMLYLFYKDSKQPWGY